ncbi:MAG: cupin domain-containing protein [Alphaproteobacteria bacterium]|nr:cupin domain-containing protein [Alphaproteobacteria bacterium]
MSKKIEVKSVPELVGTLYPPPYDGPVRARGKRQLGNVAGLTQFGVNLLRLEPGVWSAQRHWHDREDEFVYVLEGEVTLITDAGEELLQAGDAAGFKAGDPDGHHLVNKSGKTALALEVGTRTNDDVCQYPEADLVAISKGESFSYTRRDGTEYENIRRRTPDDD